MLNTYSEGSLKETMGEKILGEQELLVKNGLTVGVWGK